VTDDLVRAASSETEWLDLELAYRSGAVGSRALLEAETRLLPPERRTSLISCGINRTIRHSSRSSNLRAAWHRGRDRE